ncbi:hypothetical protein E2C01_053584 [Portunus trituberculatus]|uniref:Uncharacterized protein n=1 Tax=Portunus trituberculatus TaxID=210409 RepID=A0A5B7GH55_PORTR|nr:hypothetical protein [Portunus trituberculatus]
MKGAGEGMYTTSLWHATNTRRFLSLFLVGNVDLRGEGEGEGRILGVALRRLSLENTGSVFPGLRYAERRVEHRRHPALGGQPGSREQGFSQV